MMLATPKHWMAIATAAIALFPNATAIAFDRGTLKQIPTQTPAKTATAIAFDRETLSQTPTQTPAETAIEEPLDSGTPDTPAPNLTATSPYYPVSEWGGRLILPPEDDTGVDWVWLEVYNAPLEAQHLIGETVRLEWSDEALVQAYVKLVTTGVYLNPDTRASVNRGNVHPVRLNDRPRVGPLQSLAGVRSEDDLVVSLDKVTVVNGESAEPTLQIAADPVQVKGRMYGLVQVLAPEPSESPEEEKVDRPCPGECPIEYYRVRHYNRATGKFDGPEEVVRFPQVEPASKDHGIFHSTPNEWHLSPAGEEGWYIYGDTDAEGTFTIQAIEPRGLLRVEADREVTGVEAGAIYIDEENWEDTEARKGTIETVAISQDATEPAASHWKEGDRGLVLHLFGGIGGDRGLGALFGLVNGHFSFGLARVVREPITDELQFAIEYRQVYTHNKEGIVAGALSRAAFAGNLHRGWLGSRPFSDAIVKLDTVTEDYNFDGITISPLTELMNQLTVITSRYRTGDGTGNSSVTPSTSCVQDSSQALYITIERIKQQVRTSPQIQAWLQANPDDPQTLRFQRLVALGSALEKQLAPSGMVRPDWKQNARVLTGIASSRERLVREPSSLSNTILSWRSVLPRRAHDELGKLFLEHGANLWVLRSNQVGGNDEGILPLAPVLVLD